MQEHKFTNMQLQLEWNRRVDDYFKKNNKSKYASWRHYLKILTVFLLWSFNFYILNFVVSDSSLVVLFSVLSGLLVASLTTHTVHDGGHSGISASKFINKISCMVCDIFGGSHFLWIIRHNVRHHTFPNINGLDDDIKFEPLARLTYDQKWRPFHRFQKYYIWFLYPLLMFSWWITDLRDFFRKKLSGRTFEQKITPFEYAYFVFGKLASFTILLLVPILSHGLLLGFVSFIISSCVLGFVFSVCFQLSHISDKVEGIKGHLVPSEDYLIHQMNTTNDYCLDSRIVQFITSGLSFQVVHHLSPGVHHSHYLDLSKELKKFCDEKGLVYRYSETLAEAFRSHINALDMLGKNEKEII